MRFTWDRAKNLANREKHGFDFSDVTEALVAPRIERSDRRRDYGEERVIAIGRAKGREVVVVYTTRGETIRIISARRASTVERASYRATFPEVETDAGQ